MTTKPKLKVPADSPCVLQSCIQEIGSSVCKNECSYWPKLLERAKAGKLEVAREMNQNTKDIAATLIIILLCVIGIVNGIVHYQIGLDDGVDSVEQRTPTFKIMFVGGYVNESVYNETYYQVYYSADRNPPTLRNDSFIIGISIQGYYDNATDSAPFAVSFSDEALDLANVTIEKAVVKSGREGGWIVGFMFNLNVSSGATAYALGWMDIFLFGYGSAPGYSTIFGSYLLTIIQWEGDG